MSQIQEAVRKHYAAAATQASSTGSCCTGDDCGCTCGQVLEGTEIDLAMPLSLGCGLPVKLADLKAGDVVVDLGSGAGLDALVSAGKVGATGHVYGVDMTDEMLGLAEANRARSGISNVSFLKGRIEEIPLPDGSASVVISNCVINLSEDKGAVLREAFRVLKSGGRLAVADMVALGEMPVVEPESWAACVAGAIAPDQYRQLLAGAGFVDVSIETADAAGLVVSANVKARKS
jgi:SAM-dependent methyltransferase